jgi:peptidoglycan/LPS O-acetylase OafA/YrhL
VPSRPYPFVDWMKALGMSVIVYGHVAHATTVPLTPPIYLKQFGVAFFLFATGFTLARERRNVGEAVFNRLFQVYLFGLSLALLLTILNAAGGGRGAASNYLPFAAGLNVIVNNFPANPTTWYLGTYLHFMVIWAVWLRRIRVQTWMVVTAVAIEIPVRAVLMASAGSFVAYMLFTNWAAVFLLGMARGADADDELTASNVPYASALVAGLAAWGAAMRLLPFEPTFPFMSLHGWPSAAGFLFVSAGVSLLYIGTTALVFQATRRVAAAPAPVRFIARNSLIIFLTHMPIYYFLTPVLAAWTTSYWMRVAILLLVCLPGLALLSEGIVAVVRPEQLRRRVFEHINMRGRLGSQTAMALAQRGTPR